MWHTNDVDPGCMHRSGLSSAPLRSSDVFCFGDPISSLWFPGGRQVTPVTAGRSIATLICLRHTLRLMEPLADALEVMRVFAARCSLPFYVRTALWQSGPGLILQWLSAKTTLVTVFKSGVLLESQRATGSL